MGLSDCWLDEPACIHKTHDWEENQANSQMIPGHHGCGRALQTCTDGSVVKRLYPRASTALTTTVLKPVTNTR